MSRGLSEVGRSLSSALTEVPDSVDASPIRYQRHVDGVRYGVLDTLVGYALRRAQLAIYEDFAVELGSLDITPQRFAALVLIAANPSITQTLLGEVLGIARSGTVQVVRALAAFGWIARDADRNDARTWRLTLTVAGRTRLAVAKRRVRAHERRITAALNPEERARLVEALERLDRRAG